MEATSRNDHNSFSTKSNKHNQMFVCSLFFAFWLCSQTCQMGIHVFAYRNVLHRHILVSDFGVHLNTVPEATLVSRSTTCAGGTCDATSL